MVHEDLFNSAMVVVHGMFTPRTAATRYNVPNRKILQVETTLDSALIHMECQNTQPFVLKAGNSTNDRPNDNEPNAKLKSIYNEVKYVWMLKYGMEYFFTSLHEIHLS